MCGSTRFTTSPSSSSTHRNTPCAAGCCGPKLMLNWRISVSGIWLIQALRCQRKPYHITGIPSALGLLIARKHIVHSFPGALEVEGTELLRELDGFIDDALRLVVIAHLDVAREREVLAQWVTLKAVVGEDATQIRVAGKQDAVHVVGLPLVPIGGREQVDHAWHGCVYVRLALDPKALILARREQMIDHIEALRAFGIVDAANVDQLLELALAVIVQDRQHLWDVLGLNDHGELAKRHLIAHQLATQQGVHMLGKVVERSGHDLTSLNPR